MVRTALFVYLLVACSCGLGAIIAVASFTDTPKRAVSESTIHIAGGVSVGGMTLRDLSDMCGDSLLPTGRVHCWGEPVTGSPEYTVQCAAECITPPRLNISEYDPGMSR